MPRRMSNEELQFTTYKCKLKTLVKDECVRKRFESDARIAHQAFNLASSFFRLYCLSMDDLPDINVSTMKQCINRVCLSDNRGAKTKDLELNAKLEMFWENCFRNVEPTKVDMRGKSRLKVAVAERLLNCILTDVKTHFSSRFSKLICSLDNDIGKSESRKITHQVFNGEWENVPEGLRDELKSILPGMIERNVYFHLKKCPEKYLEPTKLICQLAENAKMSFLPQGKSWIPTHTKFDTETVLQMLYKVLDGAAMRKSVENRKIFNDVVWNDIVKMKKVKSMSRTFSFHYEITTDGVSSSVLFSRPRNAGDGKLAAPCRKRQRSPHAGVISARSVGLDPGKKNIVTTVDSNGVSLRYTAQQRKFESKLSRYTDVLKKKRNPKRASISWKTNLAGATAEATIPCSIRNI